jgi:hypothetical protein
MNYVHLYLLRWLLLVSPKQCHHQGESMFHSEPLQHQYGGRQVMVRMVEPRTGVLCSEP